MLIIGRSFWWSGEGQLELYTVDRMSSLTTGTHCSLVEHEGISPPEIADLINELCPGGVSHHGNLYLAKQHKQADVIRSADIEILFEWVRRSKYPSKPSRFQCIFAIGDLDAAAAFKREYQGEEAPVYKVVSEHGFRADMRLLDPSVSPAVKSWFANLYWQGLPHPVVPPFWEWLVPCPVVIGDRVM